MAKNNCKYRRRYEWSNIYNYRFITTLSTRPNEEKLADGIDGEDLNLLIGSMPIGSEIAESVKLNILNILNENME